jgi:putative ABC transport system permease protein
MNDLRYGLRQLLKQPGFTFVAVLTLALSIGACTAVFSLVNALLIRPLPYRAPQELVLLLQHFKAQNLERIPVSPPEYVDYETRAHSFEKIGAFGFANFNLTGGDTPERISGALVTSDVFPLLGVAPIKGRVFEPEECKVGRDDVVIISERLWQRRLGRDPQILGTKLLLNGRAFTVVGIMPEDFDFPLQLFNLGSGGQFAERADIWQPLAFTDAQMKIRYSRGFAIIARLKPGTSVAQAQAEIEAINGQMRREHKDNYPQDTSFGGDVLPLHELAVGGMRPTLLILTGAVVFVLLIACANLTTMLLARAAAREREMAIRVALGAGARRLIRQVLTESVLLAVLGGLAGVLLAFWGIDLLKAIGAQTVPRLREVNLDLRVLGMTFAVAVATGVVFGLVPGLASAKPELTESLKEGGHSSTQGRRRNRLRNGLVIAEVALALVLLMGAGLLIKSVVRLQNVNPGFNPRNVPTMEISLPQAKYPSPGGGAGFVGTSSTGNFFTEINRRIARLPGVAASGATTILPLSGSNSDSSFSIEGQVRAPNEPQPDEEIRVVTPDYFRVLQTPLLTGRFFTEADTADAPMVAIVNEALARKYFQNSDAVGKRITFDNPKKDPKWVTIVGVVGNVRHRALEHEPLPEYYTPHAQFPVRNLIVAVRSSQDPRSLTTAIRREIQNVDPDQPIANVRTLGQVLGESVAPRRLAVVLLGVFAAVALVLAAVGIYGVMSFLVVQRTHEIGVRMALGAQRSDVLRLMMGHALRLVLTGAAIGLAIAFVSSRGLQAMLYRVGAFDVPTLAGVTLVLAAVALLASYIPALRATRAEPMIALGHNT